MILEIIEALFLILIDAILRGWNTWASSSENSDSALRFGTQLLV